MSLCQDCPHRSYCSQLCMAMEEYANQDYVPRREVTMPNDELDKFPSDIEIWGEGVNRLLSNRERQVLVALLDGRGRDEIAQSLEISRKNVREIIRRLRKKRHKISIIMEGEHDSKED